MKLSFTFVFLYTVKSRFFEHPRKTKNWFEKSRRAWNQRYSIQLREKETDLRFEFVISGALKIWNSTDLIPIHVCGISINVSRIGNFWVAFYLFVKTRSRAKAFTWKSVTPTSSLSCKSKSCSTERFGTNTRFDKNRGTRKLGNTGLLRTNCKQA